MIEGIVCSLVWWLRTAGYWNALNSQVVFIDNNTSSENLRIILSEKTWGQF